MRLTRRHLILGASMAAASAYGRRVASAPFQLTPVRFDVPANACDCHTHVIGDPAKYPLAAARSYTPQQASVEELQALHRALHVTRVVIVQPSVYGTDNACTLDAIRRLGANARGIAVIDGAFPNNVLDEMEIAGIRGIRINLATTGQTDSDVARRRFDEAVKRVADRKWHVQMYATLPVISAIQREVASSPVPVVFDHFGGAQAAAGVGQPGFDVLVDLVRTARAYVKISAPYRGSAAPPAFADMGPFAKVLIAANVQRVLWGTDWPHPDTSRRPGQALDDIAPHLHIDDGLVLNQLAEWRRTRQRGRPSWSTTPRGSIASEPAGARGSSGPHFSRRTSNFRLSRCCP
jgi:predicted TIM-barrel fold metal-dependent hydrolase